MVEEAPGFLRKLREKQDGPALTPVPEPTPDPVFDEDLIPEVSAAPTERSQESLELDAILAGMDVLDAYSRYCGKMEPIVGSKRESIMISCPDPSHRDSNPSCAVNLDKGDGGVWSCYRDGIGGDKFDIAAWHFGYDVPGYKEGDNFPKLKRQMAEDLGYVFKKSLGGEEYIEPPYEPEPPAATSEVEIPSIPVASNVIPLFEMQAIEMESLRIEWEEIVKPDTFLWEWMKACTIDDLPHEYYFWLGMQAIGFAAGTEQLLYDFQKVKPNLFVCLYGRTGSGKSRALGPYVELLETAMPYEEDPFQGSTGTKILSSPASAEALLKMFSKEILDPSSMQTVDLAQVRGLLRAEEFAAFIARAARATNPMKETLIELYDVLDRDMRHTSIGGGTVVARNPYCQMVTTTQPAAIHEFLRRSDAHSGFLNRWIFATGKRRRNRISYGGQHIDVTVPANHLRTVRAHCSSPRTMTLQGAALDVWDEFFHSEIVPLHDNSDESMFSRVDLMLKKFILLFTLNELEAEPTASIVERAITLYPYLRRTYMMFSSDIAHSDYEECRVQIVLHVKAIQEQTQAPATLRQLIQRLNNKFPQNMVAQVLKTMIELDELEEILSPNKRGPKTKMYRYGSE